MALIIMTRILFTLTLLLSGGLCFGQNQLTSLISPAGGSYKHGSLKVLWTIGEITGGRAKANNLQVIQGFIQPKSISTVTGIDKDLSAKLLNVYPNPSDEFLNIVHDGTTNDLEYKLFDSQGILMETWVAENVLQVKVLDISNYSPGVYLLIIESQSLKQSMKYKIIKAHTHE